ncbi:MAG: FkbM family methyltransferase, partial [Acidimicrobiia bacterium]
METNIKLIFDLGMHKGLDARNYLAKGFDVVGLEAVPALCGRVRDENADMIASGRLQVVQRALYTKTGERVRFYVNPDHDDWGSLDRGAAEKGVGSSRPIEVETITLGDLLKAYGSPYYIKCDLEGGDAIFAVQLLRSPVRPDFVSIEATSADDLAMIRACGYTRFQIINRWTNPFTVC